MPIEWTTSFQVLFISFGVIGVIFAVLTLLALIQQARVKAVHGKDEFNHKKALVVQELDPEGFVRVQGEIWRARSNSGDTISIGSRVRVLDQDEMELVVGPWKVDN
ncbi:MAG: NfeD family protein [Bacillota bacterium]|nr:NfeD family protein [Bacillota bacterium]